MTAIEQFEFRTESTTDGGLYSLHCDGWVDKDEFLTEAKFAVRDHGEDVDDWDDLMLKVEHKYARRRVVGRDDLRYHDFDYYYETAVEPYNGDRRWKKVTWLQWE